MLKWSDELSIGVAEVDRQHRELIEHLNSLIEACNKGKGKEVVGDLMRFLDEYIVAHFRAEEELQRRYAYPSYEQHKDQHEEFLKSFQALKEQYGASGATLPLVISINRTVVGWLIDHVSKTDRAMGVYLKTKL